MKQEEFEIIAPALRHRILAVARGYRLDAEAEDVAQDTMLRLWGMRSSLPPDKPVEALAVCIARRLSVDHLRRRRTVPIGLQAATLTHPRRPDTDLEDQEPERWVEKQIALLPSTEHIVLHLRQVEQKTTDEIAAIVGISPTSVAPLLARARRKLLQSIKTMMKG